ncbi:hypothetical protein BX600DRAFT_368864, partial [Xylariales sp. PMI_506]
IDEFFLNYGATRPPVPCDHCRRLRLQCFILQTTFANPNPISCCSSCAALFRDCSLAEEGKRQPADFETSAPVIGQLHGINENEGISIKLMGSPVLIDSAAGAGPADKRSTSRSVHRTRPLRAWFACHLDYPYPSEDDKVTLIKQTGLSKSQVNDWFNNARRRKRQADQSRSTRLHAKGSPMPSPPASSKTPFERWRNSPPEEDSVSAAAIQRALEGEKNFDYNPKSDGSISDGYASSDKVAYSRASGISTYALSVSGSSSCISYSTSNDLACLSTGLSGSEDGRDHPLSTRPTHRGSEKSRKFECTFCLCKFTKKHDWLRHERSLHMSTLDRWICDIPLPPDQLHTVWRVNHNEAECIFCGSASPTEQHIQSHEFESCQERAVKERTFGRKDHLWQHLQKFHGCRKWDGWRPDLNHLRHTDGAVLSRCGFCQEIFETWQEREQHLALHFRAGMSMSQWVGELGLGQ